MVALRSILQVCEVLPYVYSSTSNRFILIEPTGWWYHIWKCFHIKEALPLYLVPQRVLTYGWKRTIHGTCTMIGSVTIYGSTSRGAFPYTSVSGLESTKFHYPFFFHGFWSPVHPSFMSFLCISNIML